MEKLKVIITGATGMIGEGVLTECLNRPEVENVLVIGRKSCEGNHPKLTEIIHDDFFDFSAIAGHMAGFNTCFFCLGVTSMGKNEEEYTRLTYSLTMKFASLLASLNPEMTFCYISATGTDSTEKGRTMWARVKGRTENGLMTLPFRKVYHFRPGVLEPFLPLRPSQTYYKTYKYLKWPLRLLKWVAPSRVIALKEFAAAMVNVAVAGYSGPILEIKDIKALAKPGQGNRF